MAGERAKVPASAAWLGGLGALPFLGLGLATTWLKGDLRVIAAHALAAYGAVILSFLGGVHWGLAVAPGGDAGRGRLTGRLIVSVVPSLVAWPALLIGGRGGLLLLAVAFAAMLLVDLRATRLAQAPAWYPSLRIPLTVAVVASLVLGFLA